MNYYIINAIFFIFSTSLIAGNLPNTFDPILGLTVSENSVIVSDDGIKRLAEEHAIVQLPVGTNFGNISAELLDEGGDITLPIVFHINNFPKGEFRLLFFDRLLSERSEFYRLKNNK